MAFEYPATVIFQDPVKAQDLMRFQENLRRSLKPLVDFAMPAQALGPGQMLTAGSLVSPPPIGSQTPNSGAFTSLSATGPVSFSATPQWTPQTGYTLSGMGLAAVSYISGTGTAGTDNTAQTVKSITLPAGALNKVGQGIRIRVFYEISAATAIVVALTLNGVTIDTKSTAVTSPERFQADVMYVDGTHANFSGDFDTGGIGTDVWTVGAIGINAGSFAFASDQVLAVTQTKVAATHVTVYEIRVEQLG